MSDDDCQAYVDRLLAEQTRWVDARFAGSDRVWSERLEELDKRLAVQHTADQRALELAAKAMEQSFVTPAQLDDRLSFHRYLNLGTFLLAAATFVLYLWHGH